jgi:hypothetical protein
MAKPKYDPSKGEFRMSVDETLEYWQDGEMKLSGADAQALLDLANAPQENAAQVEAQRPSNILRNLSDEDAAKLLDLAGIPHSGK